VASVVVVSMGEVSAVAVSTAAAAAFVAAVLAAILVQCKADARSSATELVCGVGAIGVGATGVAIGAVTDSLMMSSSSATSAFRGGGAGTIRTDITITTITRTITMGTAGTVTTTTTTPVMDTVMAADQGICGVCGGGDRRGLRLLEFALLLCVFDTLTNLLRESSRKPADATIHLLNAGHGLTNGEIEIARDWLGAIYPKRFEQSQLNEAWHCAWKWMINLFSPNKT
jgi:hypothetical protein